MNAPAQAAFLVLAFVLSGIVHVAWLSSGASMRLGQPLDGGLVLRGKRLFGDHKRVRGLVVIPPATAASFAGVRMAFSEAGVGDGLWAFDTPGYALLGLWAGMGFMLGELPNSFLKRQLGIPPGGVARTRGLRLFFLGFDRVDSILGLLVALSLVVHTAPGLWLMLLLVGPGIHLLFSVALSVSGVKERAA